MCYKNIYPLLVFALLLSSATSVHSAPVPVNLDFVGPTPSTIAYSATAQGSVTTEMFGKLFFPFTGSPNPQTDPIGLNPNTITANFTGNPIRNPVNETNIAETAKIAFDGANLWTPLSISDVNLTLLDGGVTFAPGPSPPAGTPIYSGNTIPFSLDQLVLEAVTSPPGVFDPNSDIKIDVGGRFVRLDFFQGAGAATFTGNTYAIPGTLRGIVNLDISIDAFGGGLALSTGLGTQDFETPFTLTGTLAASNTTATDADLSFDGIVSGGFLLSGISTTLTFNTFGAQASMSLEANGSIDLSMNYHMSDTAHVPEPGTFALLGLGAIGLVPLVRKRLRKS